MERRHLADPGGRRRGHGGAHAPPRPTSACAPRRWAAPTSAAATWSRSQRAGLVAERRRGAVAELWRAMRTDQAPAAASMRRPAPVDAPPNEEEPMRPRPTSPAIVRWTLRLEDATALDRPVRALEPTIRAAFGTGARGARAARRLARPRAAPAAHRRGARHLDLRQRARRAGRTGFRGGGPRLVGTGLLAVGPTAWTGWAEWSQAGSARAAGRPGPRRHQRRRDRRSTPRRGWPAGGAAHGRRGRAGPGRGGRVGARRLPRRPPRGGAQGGQPPPGVRRGLRRGPDRPCPGGAPAEQ